MTLPRCVSVADVAEACGVSESTLYTWRQRKYGPASFKQGRRVVYLEADVAAWIESQRETTGRGSAA